MGGAEGLRHVFPWWRVASCGVEQTYGILRFMATPQQLYQLRFPDRHKARRAVAAAIKRGALVRPAICSKCGGKETFIEAHHNDYSKPLDVEWLCRKCHQKASNMGRTIVKVREISGCVVITLPTFMCQSLDIEDGDKVLVEANRGDSPGKGWLTVTKE